MATGTTARSNTAKASAVTVASKSGTEGNDTGTRNRGKSSSTARHPRRAAEQVVRQHSLQVHLPIVGEVVLPAIDQLAFIGGVIVLAIVGLVEWPVAVLLSAGHVLANSSHRKLVREFGEAMEAA
jgi:hypothetical protein